jgi:acyl-CoA synthetase (AMP-forming)/AMP-acid ligase II
VSGHPRTGDGGGRAASAPSGLAILHGGPLARPPVATLGEALLRATRTAHGVVLIDGDGAAIRRSYAELYDDAARTLAGLAAAGPEPGARVILRTAQAADLLTAFWACVLGGLVPLPVPYDTDAAGLAEAVEAVGEAWLVSDDLPGPPPPGSRWAGPVSALRTASPGAARSAPALPDDPALLTLTSGSTRRPKAVPLTHRQVISRTQATALARGLDEATRSLNWMPLHHVSGIVMFHVRDVFLGCHQVHADTGWVRADPLRWLDVADAERIDTTWAPNHAFALVADALDARPARSWDLSQLRYIMNGGEAVKERTVRRFLAALASHGLPPAAMHPGWGMPETASGVVDGVFRPGHGPLRRHVPVGVPHPGVSVRVVDEGGQVLPAGVVGRLQVTGEPVVRSYLEGGEPRPAPLSGDGWLVTDDLAFVADGELTVTGRADGLISVNGVSCHGHEIEAAVEELPCVAPSFTVARSFATDGDDAGPEKLAVFFRPRAGVSVREARARVREQVLRRFGVDAAHVEALAEHELRRTATGKLRRSVLAARLPGAR